MSGTQNDTSRRIRGIMTNYNRLPGVDGPDFTVYPNFQSTPSGCNLTTAYPEIEGKVCQ